jgi:hypothetical protein
MDFTKFVSMLEEKALFFPNLSTLPDPLEGFLTKPMIDKFREIPNGLTPEETEKRRTIGELNLQAFKNGRRLLYVSSWHMSDHESAAMWVAYVKTGEGIAIQSTIGKMIKSFESATEEVNISLVKYINYDKDEMPWSNLFFFGIHKRKSFTFENEIRALVMSPKNLPGINVSVNLNQLISKVYMAPNSPSWIHELVKKMLKKNDVTKKVIHSGLEQNPLY